MSHNDLATGTATLGDRSHQKRELAAISVELTVRQIMNSDLSGSTHALPNPMGNMLAQNRSAAELLYRRTDHIQKVINYLITNFIDSEQANYRKGGLLGLAGVIMALTTKRNTLTFEGITFLNQVIPIIQKCLDDKEASVRYYANETLFNVIKVARYHIILFFDLIFDKIQILCDDEDEMVRDSNKSVNRLLQDVAVNYDHFKVKSFITNVLQTLIRSRSKRVRILALDWIIAMDAEPDIYFLVFLHYFLYPLFALLIDHRCYGQLYDQHQQQHNAHTLSQSLSQQQPHTHPYESPYQTPRPSQLPPPPPMDNNLQQQHTIQHETTSGAMHAARQHSYGGGASHRHRKLMKLPRDTQLTQKIMTDLLAEISEYLQREPADIHNAEKFDINRIVVMLVKIVVCSNPEVQAMLTNHYRSHALVSMAQQTLPSQAPQGEEVSTTANEKAKGNDGQERDDSGSDLQFEAILDYNGTRTAKTGEGAGGDGDGDGSSSRYMAARDDSRHDAISDNIATQKSVALQWLDTFITLGGARLKSLYPSILQCILYAMNDARILKKASLVNDHLMNLVLNLDQIDESLRASAIVTEAVDKANDDEEDADADQTQQNDTDLLDDIINELQEENGVVLDEEPDAIVGADDHQALPVFQATLQKYASFDIQSVMKILMDALRNNENSIQSKIAALKWISALLVDLPFAHIPIAKLLPVCFMRLCDRDDVDDQHVRFLQNTVTSMTLEVLARLSLHPKIFGQLLTKLLQLFYKNPQVLHNKGKLIITKLCSLLDCTEIYSRLANLILRQYRKKNHPKEQATRQRFIGEMVRLLNLILLTSKELYPLREIIKQCDDDESRRIFLTLYKCWCCNSPISLLSLCLLAQRYDLGLMLVNQFKKESAIHKSVQFLLEVDELIHLLESPIFLHLRLQLLCLDGTAVSNVDASHANDSRHKHIKWSQLFEIVNGLLTLLPNSDAFHQFRVRIQMISLYNQLFAKLAKKSGNASLVNDDILHDAMYYDRASQHKTENKQIEKDILAYKLYQQYLETYQLQVRS